MHFTGNDGESPSSFDNDVPVNDVIYMCIYIYIYILFNFICTKNKTKMLPVLAMSFQTKLRECFSDFLGLTKFLRLEETVDWLKLLKFSSCSN